MIKYHYNSSCKYCTNTYFECKVIKKNFNYQIFSTKFCISTYKTCKKANIHSFFGQSYQFSCIFYIGFMRYMHTS